MISRGLVLVLVWVLVAAAPASAAVVSRSISVGGDGSSVTITEDTTLNVWVSVNVTAGTQSILVRVTWQGLTTAQLFGPGQSSTLVFPVAVTVTSQVGRDGLTHLTATGSAFALSVGDP